MSYHQRNQGKPTFKNYNNFDDMNNQINQMSLNNNNNNNSKKKAVNYNDFEPDVFTTIYQELRRKMGSNNIILFNFSRLYSSIIPVIFPASSLYNPSASS